MDVEQKNGKQKNWRPAMRVFGLVVVLFLSSCISSRGREMERDDAELLSGLQSATVQIRIVDAFFLDAQTVSIRVALSSSEEPYFDIVRRSGQAQNSIEDLREISVHIRGLSLSPSCSRHQTEIANALEAYVDVASRTYEVLGTDVLRSRPLLAAAMSSAAHDGCIGSKLERLSDELRGQ